MKPFKIRKNEFLLCDRKEEEWVDLNRINEVKYSPAINAIVIVYGNKNRLVLQYLDPEEIKKIVKIFREKNVRIIEAKGALFS